MSTCPKSIPTLFGPSNNAGFGGIVLIIGILSLSLTTWQWLSHRTWQHNQSHQKLLEVLNKNVSESSVFPPLGDYGAYYDQAEAFSLCLSLSFVRKQELMRCRMYDL